MTLANSSGSVAVSCGSSGTPSDALLAAIRGLVGVMKARNLRLYFGASDLGLMGVVLYEAKRAGLWVGGVTCESLLPVTSVPQDLDELVVTDTLYERRQKLIAGADYAVFLPGGLGTLDELAGALLLRQLGQLARPVALLDPDHSYDQLVDTIKAMHNDGYMSASVDSLLIHETNPTTLLDKLAAHHRTPPVKWPGMTTG